MSLRHIQKLLEPKIITKMVESTPVEWVYMCLHGLHVCEIDPLTLFLTVLESDCDTVFTVAHGSPSFPSRK